MLQFVGFSDGFKFYGNGCMIAWELFPNSGGSKWNRTRLSKIIYADVRIELRCGWDQKDIEGVDCWRTGS